MKHVPDHVSANTERHNEDETHLQGRILKVAQVAWILIAVLSCVLFVISLPAFYTQTQSLCTGGACNGVQVSPEQAHSLAAHGISLTSYAWYSVLVTILSTLIWVSVGWLIFWHKSDSWIALLISLQAGTQGASTSIAALGSFPVLQYTTNWLSFLSSSLYTLITSNIFLFILLLGPVSIYIAIMRYRLYDIDVIINRSLVYGSLTVLLALVYFGLIIGLGSLVRLFSGQVSQSPVVIVVSTVAIFALIQPLRHRIQRIIDRRFYRSKYDAAKIIANFSSTLRDEVDLNTLTEHLVAVVQETMQPEHVSLWLRKSEREVKHE